MSAYSEIATAQFENVNSLRSYPFNDGTSLVSMDGRELPQDVVVDLHIVVPASFKPVSSDGSSIPDGTSNMAIPTVKMKSVHMSQSMVSACFVSYLDGANSAVSVTVSRERFIPYRPYRLEKLVGSSDIGGIVTFGNFDFPGHSEMYLLDAIVHPCCVSMADPAKLRSFIDARSGDRLSGDAKVEFSGYVDTSRDGKSFSLSLGEGAADELMSECFKSAGSDACGATPITSINGIRPDEDGNIVLWFH